MAIFNEEYFIDEYDDYDNDILDEMVDACDYDGIINFLDEADASFKNHKKNYVDKFGDSYIPRHSTDLLKTRFDIDRAFARDAKFNRTNKDKQRRLYGADNRVSGSKIGKELSSRGVKIPKRGGTDMEDIINSGNRNSKKIQTDNAMYKYNLSKETNTFNKNDFTPEERRHIIDYKRNEKKRAVKETCLAILDELDEI